MKRVVFATLLTVITVGPFVPLNAHADDAFGAIQLAQGSVYVNPYVRSDGTAVQGHYRSKPDGNPYNNYSYPGNTNPYTGQRAGKPDPYQQTYGSGSNRRKSWNDYND